MAQPLTPYELSLSASQLYDHMAAESQKLWRISKSVPVPYDPGQGMHELIRQRPALYTRYQVLVLRQEDAPAPRMLQAAPVGSRDEAREDLEALAKSYASQRLVRDEAEGLAMAIRNRPDLYRAFASQPAAAQGQTDPDPLRELQRRARESVTKGLASTEQDGMERAIREHPDLYAQHRKRVQEIRKVVR